MLACFWCYLGLADSDLPVEDRRSWVFHKADGKYDFNFKDSKEIYIFSVYWILETLTTVGYGDYVGHTQYEYLFTMILEVKYL